MGDPLRPTVKIPDQRGAAEALTVSEFRQGLLEATRGYYNLHLIELVPAQRR